MASGIRAGRRDRGTFPATHGAPGGIGAAAPPLVGAPSASGSSSVGIPQLDRDPLYERVYRELRRMLMEGAFAPGAELTLRALSEGFGTSDMPVRDAVRRLISEGALIARPNRSPVVRRLSREQFEEVRDVRMLVEGGATAYACAALSDAGLRNLRDLQQQLHRAAEADLALHLNLNRRFHFAIYEACAMPLLVSMIEMLWLQIGPLFRSLPIPLIRRDLPDYHRLAVDALTARDAQAASDAIKDDISTAATVILERFDQLHHAG